MPPNAATRPPSTDRAARRRAAAVAWTLVALVLLTGIVGALNRGLKGKPDWGDLQYESRWTWEHGRTAPGTAMFGYLPTTTFALWPFSAWLPQPGGVVPYIATNLAAALATLWIVYRWWLGAQRSPDLFVWPVLLAAANLQHALQANQLTHWTLVLCVGGLTLAGRGREWLGGTFVGLAALLKTMPGLFVLYFLLRRRWRAVGGMALAAVAFDILPSLAFFGVDGTLREHRAWLRRAAWHSNRHMIDDPLLRVHRHGTNASLSAVLTRWLRAIPGAQRQVILYGDPPPNVVAHYQAALQPDEVLTLDPMPPRDAIWAEKRVDIAWVPRFHVADLPAQTVYAIWLVLIAGGAAVLLWVTWRSGRGDRSDWPAAAALWMLAMFWPSPMTRHYYLAWAFPALVVIWRTLVLRRVPHFCDAQRSAGVPPLGRDSARAPRNALLATCGSSLPRTLGIAALVAWAVGVLLLGANTIRWYGVHLAVLAIVTAATAVAWREHNSPARPQDLDR